MRERKKGRERWGGARERKGGEGEGVAATGNSRADEFVDIAHGGEFDYRVEVVVLFFPFLTSAWLYPPYSLSPSIALALSPYLSIRSFLFMYLSLSLSLIYQMQDTTPPPRLYTR